MADFTQGRQTMTQGVEAARVFVGGNEADFIFGQGTQLFPNIPVPIYGVCGTRIVLAAGEKWFEFSFRMDHLLTGNAAAGWTDAGNYFRIEPQWSLDLVDWSMGKFIPAPVPVVDLGGGVYEYWARAIHPVDSAVKSAQISCRSRAAWDGQNGTIGGDTRNNPITGITIAGVALALGGFPYALGTAGEDTRMTAALQPFYPGATVVATSNIVWDITIPNVNLTAFGQINRIFWPGYLVADIFGALTITIASADLSGNFVKVAGVAIYTKAFARLKITAGTRYDPYH